MPHTIVIAMNVVDADGYAAYRAAMLPILTRYGGQFGYDLTVAAVLRSPASHPITRVFTIRFPSRAVREAFFADPEYLAAKETHFVSAVSGFSIMAEDDRTGSA
jgi:uncharacterized protein (DUF1330 family)